MKIRSGFVSNSSSSSFVAFIPKNKVEGYLSEIENDELRKLVKDGLGSYNDDYVKYYHYTSEDYDTYISDIECDDWSEWEKYKSMLNSFEVDLWNDEDCFTHEDDH